MEMQPPAPFPSFADLANLRLIVGQGRYSTLSDAQKWNHHAYDYGWRRVYQERRDTFAPGDPQGQWYDAPSADLAEAMFRRRVGHRHREQITPAEEAAARGDIQLAARYRAQDRERAALRAQIVGDGLLPNGESSPASAALVAACVRQARENLARFAERQAEMRREMDGSALSRAQADLGIEAHETKPRPAWMQGASPEFRKLMG